MAVKPLTATLRTRRNGGRWTICPACAVVLAPLAPGDTEECRFCGSGFVLVAPKAKGQK